MDSPGCRTGVVWVMSSKLLRPNVNMSECSCRLRRRAEGIDAGVGKPNSGINAQIVIAIGE